MKYEECAIRKVKIFYMHVTNRMQLPIDKTVRLGQGISLFQTLYELLLSGFYDSSKHFMSYQVLSVRLATLFLEGSLPVLSGNKIVLRNMFMTKSKQKL